MANAARIRSASKIRRMLRISILVLICLFDLSIELPVEQPTKFSLNTDEPSSLDVAPEPTSRLDEGRTLASESQNNAATVIAAKTATLNRVEKSLGAIQNAAAINSQGNSPETARLETEAGQAPLERPVSKPFVGVLEAFFRPTPLVDGIKEEEKYGNSGDKFIGIGRALVSGFEGFSNFLNAIVDLPRNAAKKTTRGLTEALNHVGARFIGLE